MTLFRLPSQGPLSLQSNSHMPFFLFASACLSLLPFPPLLFRSPLRPPLAIDKVPLSPPPGSQGSLTNPLAPLTQKPVHPSLHIDSLFFRPWFPNKIFFFPFLFYIKVLPVNPKLSWYFTTIPFLSLFFYDRGLYVLRPSLQMSALLCVVHIFLQFRSHAPPRGFNNFFARDYSSIPLRLQVTVGLTSSVSPSDVLLFLKSQIHM